jgi:hypothetical protein
VQLLYSGKSWFWEKNRAKAHQQKKIKINMIGNTLSFVPTVYNETICLTNLMRLYLYSSLSSQSPAISLLGALQISFLKASFYCTILKLTLQK